MIKRYSYFQLSVLIYVYFAFGLLLFDLPVLLEQ